MDSAQFNDFLRGDRIIFNSPNSTELEYAQKLDAVDPLRRYRDEFLVPSKSDLKDAHSEKKDLDKQNSFYPPSFHMSKHNLNSVSRSQRRLCLPLRQFARPPAETHPYAYQRRTNYLGYQGSYWAFQSPSFATMGVSGRLGQCQYVGHRGGASQ
jgi:hypothetical protein